MKKFILAAIFVLTASFAFAGQWQGVDETVVEKAAIEHGVKPRPLIPGFQGDAQLFVFLAAGVVGGFAAGYFYRGLKGGKDSGQ